MRIALDVETPLLPIHCLFHHHNMSKTNHFAPTPMGSRPGSPPPTFMSEEDRDRQALMMGPLGADKPKDTAAANQQLSTRDQALPILSYCAASIMMTVVNKVSFALRS